MNKELAQTILHDLHYTLNNAEIDHWLFFGTLLGAYRNNDFLSDDIDIVCNYKDYWKVRELFINSNWEFNCVWRKEIALYKYGRKIDILFADVEEENIYLYIYKPNKVTGKWHTEQRYIWKTKDIFPLQQTFVLNGFFWLPYNTPNILNTYYGKNWNIPDPNWNRDRNPTPNLDKNYRQIAVIAQTIKLQKYFENNYDNDWIKVYDNDSVSIITEPYTVFVTNTLDLQHVYNLQILIDILNDRPELTSVTAGVLNSGHVSISQTSRTLPVGYKYTPATASHEITLFDSQRPMGFMVKTDLNTLIRRRAV